MIIFKNLKKNNYKIFWTCFNYFQPFLSLPAVSLPDNPYSSHCSLSVKAFRPHPPTDEGPTEQPELRPLHLDQGSTSNGVREPRICHSVARSARDNSRDPAIPTKLRPLSVLAQLGGPLSNLE